MENKMKKHIASSSKRIISFIIDWTINITAFILSLYYAKEFVKNEGWIILASLIAIISIKMVFWNQGTTLGKHCFNLRIVDKFTGNKLGLEKIILRQSIGMIVSLSILNLGFIWIFIDREHQGWHDKMFNDLVVDESDYLNKQNNDLDEYIQGY